MKYSLCIIQLTDKMYLRYELLWEMVQSIEDGHKSARHPHTDGQRWTNIRVRVLLAIS